jgi:hypothetical protein
MLGDRYGAARRGGLSVHQPYDGKKAPAMADDDNKKKAGLLKTRIFLLLFFGLAILLSVTTILGTWETQREGSITPPDPLGVTAKPAAK